MTSPDFYCECAFLDGMRDAMPDPATLAALRAARKAERDDPRDEADRRSDDAFCAMFDLYGDDNNDDVGQLDWLHTELARAMSVSLAQPGKAAA